MCIKQDSIKIDAKKYTWREEEARKNFALWELIAHA